MKSTDTYTKVILTIIAIFLGVIALQNSNIMSQAKAEPTPISLPVQMGQGVVDVNVVQISGSRVSSYNGLPVVLQNTTLPVDIKNSRVPVELPRYTTIPVEVKSGKVDARVTNYRDFR